MSLLQIDIKTPPAYEAVDAVYALIDADASVTSQFYTNAVDANTGKKLYKHYRPAEPGFQSVTVRERSDLGGRLVPTSKLDDVPVHVVAECGARLPGGAENTQAHKWLARMHDLIALAIVGQSPSLTLGSMKLPIRYDVGPTTPMLDVSEDRWRSIATYRVLLNPIEA